MHSFRIHVDGSTTWTLQHEKPVLLMPKPKGDGDPFLGRASDPEDDRGRVALVATWGVPRSGRRWRAVARTREKVLTVGA